MGAVTVSQLPLVCRSPAIDAITGHKRDAEMVAARERRYWSVSECRNDHGHVLHEVRPPSLSLVARLRHAELPKSIIAPRDHQRSGLAWPEPADVGERHGERHVRSKLLGTAPSTAVRAERKAQVPERQQDARGLISER